MVEYQHNGKSSEANDENSNLHKNKNTAVVTKYYISITV